MVQFWGRVRLSQTEDRLHARVIGFACVLGTLVTAGVWVAMLRRPGAARLWVFCACEGFVVVVYVTVARTPVPVLCLQRRRWVQTWLTVPGCCETQPQPQRALRVLAAWLEWGGIAIARRAHGRWCTAHCGCWWAVFWV